METRGVGFGLVRLRAPAGGGGGERGDLLGEGGVWTFIRVTLVVISIAPAARFLFQHYTFFRL